MLALAQVGKECWLFWKTCCFLRIFIQSLRQLLFRNSPSQGYLCACMCDFVCVSVHLYVCLYMCVPLYACVCVRVHVSAPVYMCVSAPVYVCVCAHVFMHACVCVESEFYSIGHFLQQVNTSRCDIRTTEQSFTVTGPARRCPLHLSASFSASLRSALSEKSDAQGFGSVA